MLAEVRGMEDWAMRQFCRIKMDQSMIPYLYTLCYNGISKIIFLIPCGQASSAKQRCIDHRLQMQCLTEHLCWLIDTLINWVHLLSLPLVHPCRLFCSRNARNTEAKTLHPEWRFTTHLNSVLRQTCLDCPCLASIWWSRLHCCLMCFCASQGPILSWCARRVSLLNGFPTYNAVCQDLTMNTQHDAERSSNCWQSTSIDNLNCHRWNLRMSVIAGTESRLSESTNHACVI